MTIYPESFYKDIEFDQVLRLAADKAKSASSREILLRSYPLSDFHLIKYKLEAVRQLAMLWRQGESFSISEYEDVDEVLDHLSIENYALDIEEVLKMWKMLAVLHQLSKQGNKKEIRETILYRDYLSRIDPELERIYRNLNRIFEADGTVRPDASAELSRLYRQFASQEKNIIAAFQEVLQKYRARNILTEPYEAFKNGRRVLCVPAEQKRSIRGMIQDESSSGRTVYIEPAEMMPLYQDLYQIRSDIRQEINRLIRQISEDLRLSLFQCREGFMILTFADVCMATAALGIEMDGYMPQLVAKPAVQWYQAYHPLLKLKNSRAGKETIPFDLELTSEKRMMLISGPNAGGKSILLKAVALNQVMLQSGFLVPADPRSESGVFRKFLADIGDQQSLEEDLSTYSSHLKNMRCFLENADGRTLVMIDEMGSGTDPQYGGAIAEGVLDKLVGKKAWGVITTHYFNLKMYADTNERIENGAMSFDNRNLEPTYRFVPGKPGSSFAFEIAKKIGLDKSVIQYARKKSGKDKWAIEEMLVNLENEKNRLAKKEAELDKAGKNLDQLIRSNKVLSEELALQRKKWKREKKQKELQQAESDRRLIQQKIRELEKSAALEKAKKLEAERGEKREYLETEIKALNREIEKAEKIPSHFFKTLKVGDFVRYKEGEVSGRIVQIGKNTLELEVGAIRMKVKKKDVRPAGEPLEIRSGKSVAVDLKEKQGGFERKIDIRGYSIPEAEKELEQFFDDATLANVPELSILHGKGSGALRQLVKDKLREYRNVREISHPAPEQGGDGITLVKF